jgi:hypothetical protein
MRSPDFLKKLTGDSLKSAKTKHSARRLTNRKYKEDDKSNHSSDLDNSMTNNISANGRGRSSTSQVPRLRKNKTKESS